jgi:hypothetical protein
MSFGLIALLLTLLLCLLTTYGAQLLVQAISGHAQPWRANSLPMEIGVWCLCIGVGLLGGLWTKRLAPAVSLLLILQFWFLILAITSSLFLPGISYLFIVPLSLSLIVLIILTFRPESKSLKLLTFTILPLATAIIMLPIAYFIEISVSFQMSVVVGFLVGFIAIALLPLPSFLSISNLTLSTVCAGVLTISISGFIWTVVQAPYTSFKPQPLNFLYTQQIGDANLVVDAMERYIPSTIKQVLGETELGKVLPWTNASYHYAVTPSLGVEAVRADVTAVENTEQGRTVTLSLRGNDNLSGTTIMIPKSSQLQKIQWLDQTVNFENAQPVVGDTLIFQCLGQSCREQDLRLHFLGTDSTAITIAGQYPGLPAPFRHLTDARNGLSIQRQNGDQTIVLSKTTL